MSNDQNVKYNAVSFPTKQIKQKRKANEKKQMYSYRIITFMNAVVGNDAFYSTYNTRKCSDHPFSQNWSNTST